MFSWVSCNCKEIFLRVVIRTLNQKMYPACLLPIGVTGVTNEIAGVKRLSFLQFDLRKKEHKIGIGYSKLLYKELHGSLFGCLSAAIAKEINLIR